MSWSNPQARAVSRTWSSSVRVAVGQQLLGPAEPARAAARGRARTNGSAHGEPGLAAAVAAAAPLRWRVPADLRPRPDRVDGSGRRGDRAAAAPRRGAPATISARIDRAISAGVRAPMSRPAGVCSRARSSSARVERRASTASPRARLATSATYGTPASSAAASAAPRRGRARRRRRAASPALALAPPAATSKPDARGRARRAPGDRRRRRHDAARGAGSRGSRKISSAPPDRHGLCDGDGAVARRASPSPGVRGDPQQQRLAGLQQRAAPAGARVDSAQTPPTKPSIVPSASTSAASPGPRAGRALGAHDRRVHERRAPRRAAPRAARPGVVGRSLRRRRGRPCIARHTRAGRAAACRRGGRRRLAARRSPR